MDKVQRALEMRKALQLFLETMDPETQVEKMLEVASAFPTYEIGKAYKIKNVFSYGTNAVGDAQLYQVLQNHTSAEQWAPDATPSLYKAIGITEEGYPEWVQPLGASDAYKMGDIVAHNGEIWECTEVDADGNNVWEPGVFGWTKVEV